MGRTIRVELTSRDAFWARAVRVEWEYRFPARELVAEDQNVYAIDEAWLDDFRSVAGACFSSVTHAPPDPGRRRLFRRLFAPEARR